MGKPGAFIGRQVGRYRVDCVLFNGENAVVYGLTHIQLKSTHVLKLLRRGNPRLLARLQQEGQVQAQLRHKNIVPVTDIVDLRGRPGLIMRQVDGVTLEHWIDVERPDYEMAMGVFSGIVAGLSHAHARGLVHRDLHPGNVFVEAGDFGPVAVISDFGLVKVLGEPGMGTDVEWVGRVGTACYASPEQLVDPAGVDHRADLFSLGCILYQLVLHRPAYADGALRLAGPQPPDEIVERGFPPAFYEVVRRLLADSPADRPHSAEAALALLNPPATDDLRPPDTLAPPYRREPIAAPPSPGVLLTTFLLVMLLGLVLAATLV